MLRIRVGLGNVFALDIHAFEFAGDRGVEHVRDAKAGCFVQLNTPGCLKSAAGVDIADMLIAG